MKIQVLSSLFVALLLSVVPLPLEWAIMRPDCVAMMVIYWVLLWPESIGLGTIFLTGLLLDILTATLLGEHAVALIVLAYISLKMRLLLRHCLLWQQAIVVVLSLFVYRLLLFGSQTVIHSPPAGLAYWLAPLFALVLWPWMVLLSARRPM